MCGYLIIPRIRSMTKKGNAATDVLDVEKTSAETPATGTGTAAAATGTGAVVTEERDEWGRLKNLTLHTLVLVFIPDLLIALITKFLGDDDVAIRFVCKPAHMNLNLFLKYRESRFLRRVALMMNVMRMRWRRRDPM